MLLSPGEHPFVRHETCVFYRAAHFSSEHKLDEHRASGVLDLRAPLTGDLLTRIQDGALRSPLANEAVRHAITSDRSRGDAATDAGT